MECHGDSTKTGSSFQLADAAPPRDAQGNAVSLAVGAHQTHVRGKLVTAGVPCASCHHVPASLSDHVEGAGAVTLRDPVGNESGTFTARSGSTAASCAATYCHGSFPGGAGSQTLAWNQSGNQSACTTCHGNPPATGKHPSVFRPHAWMGTNCTYCHFDVVATSGAIKPTGRSLHVNGVKDVTVTNSDGTAAEGTYSAAGCLPGCHSSVSLDYPQPW